MSGPCTTGTTASTTANNLSNPPNGSGRPHDRPFDAADLLSRVWRQNLPIMQDRLACLDSIATEAAAGVLAPDRRTLGSDVAHKLAGSLGMFGYPLGTESARKIEQHLEAPGPLDAALLLQLTRDLHAALPL